MKAFLDTNILVYAFGTDHRAARATSLMVPGVAVGIQCLNEFANVARNKLGMNWLALRDALKQIETLCEVSGPLDLEMHRTALAVAERYRLSIFDSLIIAAAIRAGCDTLWSEDMQDGLVIDPQLTIKNPFRN